MAVEKGQQAPDVTLYDTDMKEVKISDFFGKNTVICFVPGAFTAPCTKELCTLEESISKFNGWNSQVIAISVDSPFANAAWIKANRLTFPVLSDFSRTALKAYNVYHEDFVGLKGYTAAKRSVFVLDKDGIVRYKWVTEDPGVEPPYNEIEKVVDEIK